ncbi:MAG TPA: HAMP domain-containing sensor histidine kinase [Gemmatimonadaceae bacterium]|nr:HAMP domain-containing sensor histidine kinase [Gemmatimonadaceae bacterium]
MRRPSRSSVGTVLLLSLALVLVAVLAYQAQDAARSHQRTAERTLDDYASFASWQLTQQAKNSLLSTMILSFSLPASRVDPRRLPETLLSPGEVEAVARSTAAWCRCLDGVRYFFRYDWQERTLRTTETELPDAALAWARDTVVAYARSLPALSARQPMMFGSPDGSYGPLRQLAVVLTNDSYGMIFGAPPSPAATEQHQPGGAGRGSQLLVFVVVRAPDGQPVVVYGFDTEPRPYLAPTFQVIHHRNALLPPSLLRDMPADSVLAISVSTQQGEQVFRSPGDMSRWFSAEDTIESNFGRLVMRVALRPEIAGRLIVGGLPHSRLPILVGVFLLTAGLLGVALLQLRRQQELARLRTEFVAGVSHELRTPLAQIRWFAELLQLGKLRSEEERTRSAVIIDQEARRLTYLVENVLNFSRGERGTNRIAPVRLDLEPEIRETLELFAPLARARRATLRAELEPGLAAEADRDALRQILLNLLDNAVKYGPAGQTVTVGTASGLGSTHPVRIWVEDEGPGIPEAERTRVWEPYVRLNRAVELATGGSGIGLAVVRELVTLHGGRTAVEAAAAGGARVVIELPAAAGAAPAPPELPELPRTAATLSGQA